MRRALWEARWSPDDDPEEVVATLERLIDGITSVVDDPQTGGVDVDKARVVFASGPLSDLYVFAAAVKKTVDQAHPVHDHEGRMLPREAFVQRAAGAFPKFHRMQRELSEALYEAFPEDGDDGDDVPA